MQLYAQHGWAVVDSVEYRTVANMYGHKYVRKNRAAAGQDGEQSSSERPFRTAPKAEMVPGSAQVVVAVRVRDTANAKTS